MTAGNRDHILESAAKGGALPMSETDAVRPTCPDCERLQAAGAETARLVSRLADELAEANMDELSDKFRAHALSYRAMLASVRGGMLSTKATTMPEWEQVLRETKPHDGTWSARLLPDALEDCIRFIRYHMDFAAAARPLDFPAGALQKIQKSIELALWALTVEREGLVEQYCQDAKKRIEECLNARPAVAGVEIPEPSEADAVSWLSQADVPCLPPALQRDGSVMKEEWYGFLCGIEYARQHLRPAVPRAMTLTQEQEDECAGVGWAAIPMTAAIFKDASEDGMQERDYIDLGLRAALRHAVTMLTAPTGRDD